MFFWEYQMHSQQQIGLSYVFFIEYKLNGSMFFLFLDWGYYIGKQMLLFIFKDVWWEPISWTSLLVKQSIILYISISIRLIQQPWSLTLPGRPTQTINESTFVIIHNYLSHYIIRTCLVIVIILCISTLKI
jgi:hypothetical protein